MPRSVVKIPKPTVFLRNKFAVKPGLEARFFQGQEELLRKARPKMELVAAFGTRPVLEGKPAPNVPASMIHVWEIEDERALYASMFTFSESEWYVKEVQSLQSEHQDLLVLTAQGIKRTPRPKWRSPDDAGYVYVYEELRVRGRTKLSFLRDLNWLASQARARQCELTWLSTEITGTPSQVCVLWRAPAFDEFESFLREMTYERAHADRYAQLMLGLDYFSREYMYPESTEAIQDRLPPAPPPAE